MKYSLFFLIFFAILYITSCEKIERLTIQKTVGYADGKAEGKILDLSNASHTDYGFCWDNTQNPTINKHKLSLGLPKRGDFTATLPLVSGNWYIKTYIAEGNSYLYGNEININIAKPVVQTLAATNVGYTSATLNASIIANNSQDTVYFEYGYLTDYGNTISASPQIVNGTTLTNVYININNLASPMVYHYRAKVVRNGEITYGNDITFKTNLDNPDIVILDASNILNNYAMLNGTVNANNNNISVTFQYGVNDLGQSISTMPSVVTGNIITPIVAQVFGLTPQTLYQYRIAVIIGSDTFYSNIKTFQTTQTSSATVAMVSVVGGSFSMGCGTTPVYCSSYDVPIHTVTLSNFYIGKYEITQQQYIAAMHKNPSLFTGNLNQPVDNVTWYDAVNFCNVQSQIEGLNNYYNISGTTVTINPSSKGYRLPTEAEWEYAARGGIHYTDNYLYSGSNNFDDVALRSEPNTYVVGTKAPNQLGIYDMTGNVQEWCWDWSGDYSSDPQTNPIGSAEGTYKITRGGYGGNDGIGIANRLFAPLSGFQGTGFRVVKSY